MKASKPWHRDICSGCLQDRMSEGSVFTVGTRTEKTQRYLLLRINALSAQIPSAGIDKDGARLDASHDPDKL